MSVVSVNNRGALAFSIAAVAYGGYIGWAQGAFGTSTPATPRHGGANITEFHSQPDEVGGWDYSLAFSTAPANMPGSLVCYIDGVYKGVMFKGTSTLWYGNWLTELVAGSTHRILLTPA